MSVEPGEDQEIIGTIMSTYYGGRSEVRIRREVRQVVLCDFLSMYPTVCTLMGLWRFVIASGMTWYDDTEAVRTMLQSVTLDDLQQPDTWRALTVLVQVEAAADVFPVRAAYDTTGTTTIGLNHLTCGQPLWFTLADCIASKLLTGRAPRVLRAVRYAPKAPQAGLQTVAVNGNADFRVRPDGDDFYRRLIELRQNVKRRRDAASGDEREHFDALQNALKIAANATSYGIFAEVNVDEPGERRTVRVHTGSETPYEVATRKVEEPGRYFHPLVATLITGAARLMLALAERQVTDAGLGWAFCDTDSMAIAKPVDLDETAFHARVDAAVEWFTSLNPYGFGGTVLKVEDVNADLTDSTRRAPLFCYAVSAKRYVLFNIDADGAPVLRKASAHGLGHLQPPYNAGNPAPGIPKPSVSLGKLGVAVWQHVLWWLIARGALHEPVVRVPLDHHEAMQQPALSRYAATTPDIHRWFGRYNESRAYDEQVRPFGFLNAFTSRNRTARPVAPFDRDPARSASAAFDRNSGETVQASELATYATVLAQYHLHAESKFRNGRPLDSGTTMRRHVAVLGTTYIGKEANRWEEQFFVGIDLQAAVDYGGAPDGRAHLINELLRARSQMGERALAEALGISRETLRRLLTQQSVRLDGRLHYKIARSVPALLSSLRQGDEERSRVLAQLTSEIDRDGLTPVARRIGCDPANLAAIRSGRRAIPERLLSRIRGVTGISNGLSAVGIQTAP